MVNQAPKHIDEMLGEARARLRRLTPRQALAEREQGALLVDIRYTALRERDGVLPGALVVERNELEWRMDPQCTYKLPQARSHDQLIILVCNEGYASSLAAVSLQRLGLYRATDVIGGFQAWADAALPVTRLSPTAS
jgi:rhodanese-related sulfurtransferase